MKTKKVAEVIVNYSTEIKEGDKVQINTSVLGIPLAEAIYELTLEKGAIPWVNISEERFEYLWFKKAEKNALTWFPTHKFQEIKNTDVWIGIRAPGNTRLLSSVPPDRISVYRKTMEKISEYRVERTRWVIINYPTNALAQEADMSLEEYENFWYKAVVQDWKRLSQNWKKIAEKLERTDKVRILGEKTDLTFSVKGRKPIVADGKYNLPDGEVFTSVVENSTEGEIYFDLPSTYAGKFAQGITLKFRKGKVTEADAETNKELVMSMLNTDSGAKRLGEFGIGLNYKIKRPVKDILFDEKIGGTIHLAIGKSYSETLGKNKSAVHWDMIKDMRKNGEIYFDDELVFRKGRWLI